MDVVAESKTLANPRDFQLKPWRLPLPCTLELMNRSFTRNASLKRPVSV